MQNVLVCSSFRSDVCSNISKFITKKHECTKFLGITECSVLRRWHQWSPLHLFSHLHSVQYCGYISACHQEILKCSTFLKSYSIPSLFCRCMKNAFVGSGIDVAAISASLTIQLHYLFGEILWNGVGKVKLREIYCILVLKEFVN